MRLECFSTGRVRSKRRERGLRRYLPGGWSDATLPVNAFVLEHTLGLCVFDTGQTAAASQPGYHQRWHPFLRVSRFELEPEDELPGQLRARGLDPGDVRWVVLSHLHTDHIGTVEIVSAGRRDRLGNGVAARPGAAGQDARLHPATLASRARGASG